MASYTCTHRSYIYTDNVRPNPAERVYVFDLDRPSGRTYFAQSLSAVENGDGANFDVTQWDGFEILLVMGGQDFPRSKHTARSGLYRGAPSADWYHLGWPLRWGQGVLLGMEAVMARTNNNTAVECSFMAPGLGPWRPAMVPYVDERDTDSLIGLGLRWHGKMLFRTEVSGVIVNPYHTPLAWARNATELAYWLGGLVTGGVAPQVSEFGGPLPNTSFTIATTRHWMDLYTLYGHMVEGGITTSRYDTVCCHTQGECEWQICRDVILSRLVGGSADVAPGSRYGLYVGSAKHTVVPATQLPEDNATVLVFASWEVPTASLTLGSAAATRCDWYSHPPHRIAP